MPSFGKTLFLRFDHRQDGSQESIIIDHHPSCSVIQTVLLSANLIMQHAMSSICRTSQHYILAQVRLGCPYHFAASTLILRPGLEGTMLTNIS